MVDNLTLFAIENGCPVIEPEDKGLTIIDLVIAGVILWLILGKR